jgi:2,4-dienoyl-CoA reductase-like NADH-dependent reductase (Old Yellow Enzyme family)
LIEPRFDEFKSASEKEAMLGSMSVGQNISLEPFKRALGSTKLLSAGGYGPDNYANVVSAGTSDLVAFGRYFM